MPWDSRAVPVSQETLSKDCGIMLHSARDHLPGQSALEDSNEVSDAPLDFPISSPATPRWSYASSDERDGSQDHVIDYAGLFAHYVEESPQEPIMDGTVDENATSSSGHIRGASDNPSTTSSSDRTHSDSSIPESSKTSGGSSLSSMARKVARHAGPDMRLIDVDRSEWASKFYDGRYRRWSTSSNNSNQSDKGDASRSTSATATQSNLGRSTPPSPWPLPDTPLVTRKRSTDALAAQKAYGAANESPPQVPSSDVTTPGSLNTTSNIGPANNIAPIDETYSPQQVSAYPWDSVEKHDEKPLSNKRSRPSFPRWKSHRSQRSKDTRSSGQSPPVSPSLSPPLSPNKVEEDTATAVQMKKVTATQLYQQKSRRSLKRWLWPGPLSASDAQSIGEVIQPQEVQALNPAEGFTRADALPHAKALVPITGPESPTRLRRDRVISPLNSSHPSASQSPVAGRGHGFVPQSPDLFTPFSRIDRRERTSYFAVPDERVKEDAQENARRQHYSPDYIGSALGGRSPPRTPNESPDTSEPKQPEYLEYMSRCGTARNSTFPAGFSPPEDATPTSPFKRSAFVPDRSSPQQTTSHPASQFPALGAHPVRPPRARRQIAAASSGHWDSDAVLMSQPDMTTPDEKPYEPASYMYPDSPSRSTRASTVTTTSLATANTSATTNTTATTATALSDSTVKPRPSTSSIATSSTTTALPRASPATFHRPLSHRNSTSTVTTPSSPKIGAPTPPATPGTTANTALRRVRRESTRSEARSLPESMFTTGTTGTTGSGGTSRSGPPKPRDWFRVRMDQIMADDVGGAAAGGIANLPPPSPVPRPGSGASGGGGGGSFGGSGEHAPRRPPLRSTLSDDSNHGPIHNGRNRASSRVTTSSSSGDVGPEFVWDVPEHLPGSPLCPLSPKHRGGGKGICVYHGRRKTQRTAELML